MHPSFIEKKAHFIRGAESSTWRSYNFWYASISENALKSSLSYRPPFSRTATFKPFDARTPAAHPPPAPDPMTTTSTISLDGGESVDATPVVSSEEVVAWPPLPPASEETLGEEGPAADADVEREEWALEARAGEKTAPVASPAAGVNLPCVR